MTNFLPFFFFFLFIFFFLFFFYHFFLHGDGWVSKDVAIVHLALEQETANIFVTHSPNVINNPTLI